VQFRPSCIEEKFLFEGRDENRVGFYAALQTGQRRQGGLAVLVSAGESLLKSMISRKNRRCVRNLLIALPDQLLKNLRAALQTRFDLRERLLVISASDDQVGCALQQRQERDQEEKQPAPETTESKFQR
jgi:hypothetical protein